MAIDFEAWYKAVQDAIAALPGDAAQSRAQQFVKQFPDCLTRFSAALNRDAATPTAAAVGTATDSGVATGANSTATAAAANKGMPPLDDFQRHPNYLLRFLLAEWRDEEKKTLRTSLEDVMAHSARRVTDSQRWRRGEGDFWRKYGYKDLDDLYTRYKCTPEVDTRIQGWFFQRVFGRDLDGYPVHYDLLPNSHDTSLLRDMTLRRVVNNEYSLRHREWVLNPPPVAVRGDGYSAPAGVSAADAAIAPQPANPRIGVTWIIDCRRLSIWQSAAIYKTAQAMIEASQQVTSQNYPEQGHRTLVLNLGVVFGSMYNLAMKVMPAQTQRTTKCSVGNEALQEAVAPDQIPKLFREPKTKLSNLTPEEEAKSGTFDRPPFMT